MMKLTSFIVRFWPIAIAPFLLFGCTSENPKSEKKNSSYQIIAGKIKYGPERTVFVPCKSDEVFWLNNANQNSSIKQAAGWDSIQTVLQSQPKCTLQSMPCEWQTAFVKGRAIVNRDTSKAEQTFWTGKGFGHDGNPAEIRFYEIEVTASNICSKLDRND